MEATNITAEVLLTTYSSMLNSLKNSESPALLVFGIMRNVTILQNTLKDYFAVKGDLIKKYNITSDEQINSTDEGKAFTEEFLPIANEVVNLELHKLNITFEELCTKMENSNAVITGDVRSLELICKDDSESESPQETD